MSSVRPLVFVVDDEEPVRRSLRTLLRLEGFSVEIFGSGAEVLAAAERAVPDCVLTDLHMPGMDGQEVIAQLVRHHPALPVVLMTGRDDPGQLGLAGHVRLVAKPFDANILVRLLRAALRAREHD
jgi:two-component system response regulator FixJ